jgi:Mn2+/Fe2+ NRAMP family transporter
VAELFHWRASLESKPRKAPQFYLVLTLATVLGVSLNLLGMNPIRALYWSAVINGVVAVPLMFMLMSVSDNPTVVGQFRLPRYLRVLGWISTAVMLVASLGFFASFFYPHK